MAIATKLNKLRPLVLNRDRHVCQMCGAFREDRDPYTGHKVQLKVGYVVPPQHGGHTELGNLRTLCCACDEGFRRIPYLPRPNLSDLLKALKQSKDSDLKVLESLLCAKLTISR